MIWNSKSQSKELGGRAISAVRFLKPVASYVGIASTIAAPSAFVIRKNQHAARRSTSSC